MTRAVDRQVLGEGGSPPSTRTILHVDLDAFFAAVEVRENPDLAGRPVVVGADPREGRGRGVVAAASYEARRFGIHSAMPISEAYRRCPGAAYLRPRGALYAEVSRRFMQLLRRYTPLVEPISIDEAFLDVTGSQALFGEGEQIARRIKEDVRREQRLTASVGVAPNKFVAKIASDLRKPDGLVVVPPDGVEEFFSDLPVDRLWGAGPRALGRFRELGVRTIGEARRITRERLLEVFGESLGIHFYRLVRGVDDRRVVPEHERKSVGRETTFLTDVVERAVVERTLLELVEQVAHRLRLAGLKGDTVTVKLRSADFATVTRQGRLEAPADTTEAIWPTALGLLGKADLRQQAVRLVGVSVSRFGSGEQLSLFGERAEKGRRIASAVDSVSARFGAGAIKRGAVVERAGSPSRKPGR